MAKKARLEADTPHENIKDNQPFTAEPQQVPETKETSNSEKESVYRKWFYGSLLAMLCIIWISGYNVGLCTDEIDMNQYGHANINYYSTGGKDTSFLDLQQYGDTSHGLKALRYYGSNFEFVAAGFTYLTGTVGGKNEYNVRHALNQLFVVLAILFAGLCAARIKGYRAALIAGWLLFLTPAFFGWGLVNTKDIPFCAGYIATLYFMIRFLEQLPAPDWRATIGLLLALTFTLGVRIGGLLLIAYLLLFVVAIIFSIRQRRQQTLNMKVFLSLVLKLSVVICGALILTILLWPYVLMNPVANLIEAISSAKKFPAVIGMNFKGEKIFSNDLPPGYLITSMLNTLPVFVLIASGASIVYLGIRIRRVKIMMVALLFLGAFMPLATALQANISLYNGWRHLLFFYPCLMVLTGVGIDGIMGHFTKPAAQVGIALVCLCCMAHPVLWSVKNHPYEYTYYNEITGFEKGYYDFENDIWTISVKPAMDWLTTHQNIASSGDTLVIASNVPLYVRIYLKTFFPDAKVKVITAGASNYADKYMDYLVLNTIFLGTDYLHNYYPPEGTIHTENIAGYPVTAVIKDSTHLQYKCVQAILGSEFKKADSLLEYYKATNNKMNPYMSGVFAIDKAMNGEEEAAINYANKALTNDPRDFFGHATLSFISFKRNRIEDAVNHINICLEIAPNDGFILQLADSISSKMPK